jgi:general L-amino acid transport system permease protein
MLEAFLVGLGNTLRAAVVGIVLTTILGTLIGIGRLSRNFLLRSLCTGYVELFRNIPVLIQLLMWYFVLNEWLPPVSDALNPVPGIFLSKSGMSFPVPEWEHGHLVTLAGLLLGIACAWAYRRWARNAFLRTGIARPMFWPAVVIVVLGALLGWLAGGAPTALELPVRNDFNISGGGAVTPEFLAVTIGLTVYTASFVAEIVRSGIQAVSWGQTEAAGALGLTRGQAL